MSILGLGFVGLVVLGAIAVIAFLLMDRGG